MVARGRKIHPSKFTAEWKKWIFFTAIITQEAKKMLFISLYTTNKKKSFKAYFLAVEDFLICFLQDEFHFPNLPLRQVRAFFSLFY